MATLHFTKKELAAINRINRDYERLIEILRKRKKSLGVNLTLWGCVSFIDQTIMSELIKEMLRKAVLNEREED